MFAYIASVWGSTLGGYGLKGFDKFLHFSSGFLMLTVAVMLYYLLSSNNEIKTKQEKRVFYVFINAVNMAIALCWEFFEYTFDKLTYTDMQKDKIVRNISSVALNEKNENVAILIKDIDKTIIEGKIDNKKETIVINGGYLDIGINDTIKDMMVNCVGAIIFSIIGYCYINGRKEGQVVKYFVPKLKQTVNK